MSDQKILYSFRRCPYAMRARLAVASSQELFELREIILRAKPEHMLEISPKGTVPVAQLKDGTVIDESLDIALWALRQNDPEHLLTPDRGTEPEMLSLIERQDTSFKPLLDRYKYHFHSDEDAALAARQDARRFLADLDSQLANGDRLFGDRTSLADICIWPFIRQFAHVDKEWFWALPYPHLIEWLDVFLNSDRFAAIMKKYALWVPDQQPVFFPEAVQNQ